MIDTSTGHRNESSHGSDQGMMIVSVLLAAIGFYGGIGWLIGHYTGASWCLLVGILLGFAIGIYTIIKRYGSNA